MPNKRAKGRERGREIERERLFTVPSRSLMVFKGSARGSGAPCLVSCLGIGAAPITAQRPCLGRGVSHPVQSGVTTFSDSLLRPARTPPCVCVCVCVCVCRYGFCTYLYVYVCGGVYVQTFVCVLAFELLKTYLYPLYIL